MTWLSIDDASARGGGDNRLVAASSRRVLRHMQDMLTEGLEAGASTME